MLNRYNKIVLKKLQNTRRKFMDKKKSIAAGVVSLTLLALGAYNIAANDDNETKDAEVYTKVNATSEESSSTKKDDKVSDKDQSKVVAGKAKVSKDEVLDQLYTTKDGDAISAKIGRASCRE